MFSSLLRLGRPPPRVVALAFLSVCQGTSTTKTEARDAEAATAAAHSKRPKPSTNKGRNEELFEVRQYTDTALINFS